MILLGVAPLAVMGLSPTGSELYTGAAASLCVFLGLVTLRHLVRLWRQDVEEWGSRGGLDLLVDLQIVIWFPLILMLGGFVATALHFSFGGPCTLLGMLGCALMGVMGFATKFWIDCKSGVSWWRTEIPKVILGLGLLIPAFCLIPNYNPNYMPWIVGLFVGLPVFILLGLFVHDVHHLRKQHPGEWKSRLMEKWRPDFGMDKKEEEEFWFQKLDAVDLKDAAAVERMITQAKASRDPCLQGLVGYTLWRDVGTKELGRPLLEEAAAAGDEFACMSLHQDRVDQCDLDNPEEVQALADEAMAAPNPDLAYDLGMRLVHTAHEAHGKKLLRRMISEGQGFQVVQAKLSYLDIQDETAVFALAEEARSQQDYWMAFQLGSRLQMASAQKSLGRELMEWAAMRDQDCRKCLRSRDELDQILARDLGDPRVRDELEAEAKKRRDGGDFAATIASALWSHDAEAGRRLFLWAEAQGNDLARFMLNDHERRTGILPVDLTGGTPALL